MVERVIERTRTEESPRETVIVDRDRAPEESHSNLGVIIAVIAILLLLLLFVGRGLLGGGSNGGGATTPTTNVNVPGTSGQ